MIRRLQHKIVLIITLLLSISVVVLMLAINIMSQGQSTQRLRNTLENVLSACRWNQKIRTGIRQAIGYLNTSAIADYRTAFDLIENKISDDRIKYIHKACLYKERKKKCYLISDKGGKI